MSEAYAGRGPDGGGVGATGPDAVAGPATTCGAGVASGAGAWATGGGESNTGALTGALKPADGVVAVGVGSVGAIGAGGTAPAAFENGVPDCSPLSKLCTNSPGVTPWVGPVGASGVPPVKGGTGDAASGEPPPVPESPGADIVGVPGTCGSDGAATGGGDGGATGPVVGLSGGVPPRLPVSPAVEPAVRI